MPGHPLSYGPRLSLSDSHYEMLGSALVCAFGLRVCPAPGAGACISCTAVTNE